jgi:hypothetical protein
MEKVMGAFEILTINPTGKRYLGRSRNSLEGKIGIYLKYIVVNRRIGMIRLWIGIVGQPSCMLL